MKELQPKESFKMHWHEMPLTEWKEDQLYGLEQEYERGWIDELEYNLIKAELEQINEKDGFYWKRALAKTIAMKSKREQANRRRVRASRKKAKQQAEERFQRDRAEKKRLEQKQWEAGCGYDQVIDRRCVGGWLL